MKLASPFIILAIGLAHVQAMPGYVPSAESGVLMRRNDEMIVAETAGRGFKDRFGGLFSRKRKDKPSLGETRPTESPANYDDYSKLGHDESRHHSLLPESYLTSPEGAIHSATQKSFKYEYSPAHEGYDLQEQYESELKKQRKKTAIHMVAGVTGLGTGIVGGYYLDKALHPGPQSDMPDKPGSKPPKEGPPKGGSSKGGPDQTKKEPAQPGP